MATGWVEETPGKPCKLMTVFALTEAMLSGLPQNGPSDPIEYYRRPWVGRLFRERINRGLRLLPVRRFPRALEVGYGAGAVQLVLSDGVDELYGIDLDADADLVTRILADRGKTAHLQQGSVYELPYPDGFSDLCVSFRFSSTCTNRRAGWPRSIGRSNPAACSCWACLR